MPPWKLSYGRQPLRVQANSFALRQDPNRSTGYSPFELVYGRNVHTPLDVVFGGKWEREKVRCNNMGRRVV